MRYVLLDVIRIIAICLVLTAHICQIIGSPVGNGFGIRGFYYVTIGGVGVTVFLVLSGVALELKYGGKMFTYFSFELRRFLRIYPVYYMSLIVGVVIYLHRIHRESAHFLTALSRFGAMDIILSLTGFYAFAGKWGGPFVSTSWYLGPIVTMYLVYPLLSKMIRRMPRAAIILLFFVSALSRIILGKYGILPTRPLDWFPLCRIFEFSLGIYLVVVLSGDIWSVLNFINSKTAGIIRFMSEISFPLFLIHWPLEGIINFLIRRGVNQIIAILIFIAASVVSSWALLCVGRLIPRYRLES